MSRIKACLDTLKANGRKALIPYITAGDPHPRHTVSLMHALVDAGADILELGIPFSDPMADGPVIQLACERALKHDVSLRDVLRMVAEFRQQDARTPVVLMGYLNPVEALGYEVFAKEAKAAGVDGVLTVDLPPEEAEMLVDKLRAVELDAIFLLAPTTSDPRIASIARFSSGYVYYVSLNGVTGSARLDSHAVQAKLKQVKSHTLLPVGVGFGIRDAETARDVGQFADGVIVGSVIVNKIAEFADRPDELCAQVSALIRPIRQALDTLKA